MATIAQLLAINARQVDELLSERDRLVSERRKMLALRAAECVGPVLLGGLPLLLTGVAVCDLDPGEFQTRADSALALIQAIEDHVGVRLPPLEQKARAGDVDAARKATDTTALILRAVRGVSPVSDAIKDANRLVQDIKRDTAFAVGGVAFFGLAVLTIMLLK